MTIVRINITALFAAGMFALLPLAADAAAKPVYPRITVVETSAMPVTASSSYGAFTVTFAVEATGEDVFIPASTERIGTEVDTEGRGVEYSFFNGADTRLATGMSAGTIIGDGREGRYYKVPKNTTRELTLLAVFDAPPTTARGETYQMRVVGFNYTLRDSSNEKAHHTVGLNRFTTDELELQ